MKMKKWVVLLIILSVFFGGCQNSVVTSTETTMAEQISLHGHIMSSEQDGNILYHTHADGAVTRVENGCIYTD